MLRRAWSWVMGHGSWVMGHGSWVMGHDVIMTMGEATDGMEHHCRLSSVWIPMIDNFISIQQFARQIILIKPYENKFTQKRARRSHQGVTESGLDFKSSPDLENHVRTWFSKSGHGFPSPYRFLSSPFQVSILPRARNYKNIFAIKKINKIGDMFKNVRQNISCSWN